MMIQQAIVPDLVDGNVQEDGYILVSEQQSSQDEEDTSNKSTSSDSSVTVLIVEEESESSAAEQPILPKHNSIRPRPSIKILFSWKWEKWITIYIILFQGFSL